MFDEIAAGVFVVVWLFTISPAFEGPHRCKTCKKFCAEGVCWDHEDSHDHESIE